MAGRRRGYDDAIETGRIQGVDSPMQSSMRTHNSDCTCPLCVADRMAPSPLEIAIACARIRSGWSKAERRRRIVDDSRRRRDRGWRPPYIAGGPALEMLG